MNFKFDIFMRLPDGRPLLMDALESLDLAKERLANLASVSPREYFIYSEKDGGMVGLVTQSQEDDVVLRSIHGTISQAA